MSGVIRSLTLLIIFIFMVFRFFLFSITYSPSLVYIVFDNHPRESLLIFPSSVFFSMILFQSYSIAHHISVIFFSNYNFMHLPFFLILIHFWHFFCLFYSYNIPSLISYFHFLLLFLSFYLLINFTLSISRSFIFLRI